MTNPLPPTIRCPRCFTLMPFDTYSWTAKEPTSTGVDAEATAYTGHPVTMGTVHTAQRRADADPNWSPLPADVDPATVDEVCPTCHFVLPPHWRFGSSTCIAMAGARYTGKTVYIAVLVRALQRLAEQYGHPVIPADQSTTDRYHEIYEKPLYVEQGIAASTPSANTDAHHPLIFHLGRWQNRPRYLVIRDVAGEDLENPQNVRGPVFDFFSRADAVFFLFDPLRVQEVSAQLRDLIPVPPALGGDPRDVLRTVLSLIGDGRPRLAVVLSKFDAFQKLAEVEHSAWGAIMSNAGAAFNRDPGLISRQYDENDGALLDAEVRSLLQRLGAGPELRHVRNLLTGATYEDRFFAVSALGESPSGEKLHRNGISPFRCTDPVRWLFAGTGVLEDEYS